MTYEDSSGTTHYIIDVLTATEQIIISRLEEIPALTMVPYGILRDLVDLLESCDRWVRIYDQGKGIAPPKSPGKWRDVIDKHGLITMYGDTVRHHHDELRLIPGMTPKLSRDIIDALAGARLGDETHDQGINLIFSELETKILPLLQPVRSSRCAQSIIKKIFRKVYS